MTRNTVTCRRQGANSHVPYLEINTGCGRNQETRGFWHQQGCHPGSVELFKDILHRLNDTQASQSEGPVIFLDELEVHISGVRHQHIFVARDLFCQCWNKCEMGGHRHPEDPKQGCLDLFRFMTSSPCYLLSSPI